jgi:alpha-tubulin suppressor-like RCC1 family protein
MRNLLPIAFANNRKVKSIGGGWEHSCAILDDNSLRCFGKNNNGQEAILSRYTQASNSLV